jgi:hypothetical protein
VEPGLVGAAGLRSPAIHRVRQGRSRHDHLFPVYREPDLLDHLPEALRQHMHGKACFNFKNMDRLALEQLRVLTASAYQRYRDKGVL